MLTHRFSKTVIALLTAGALLLAACSGQESKPSDPAPQQPTQTQTPSTDPNQPSDGGTLTIGTFSDIVTLNPMMYEDTSSGDLIYLMFANLYDLSAKGELEVNERTIAAALPQVSPDSKVYTVKLKDYAKWHDGSPITAEDVAFTFNTIANEKVGSPNYSYYAQLKEAKALDPTTVQFELNDVDARFALNCLNSAPVPAKVFKDVPPEEINNHPFGKDVSTASCHQGVDSQHRKDASRMPVPPALSSHNGAVHGGGAPHRWKRRASGGLLACRGIGGTPV